MKKPKLYLIDATAFCYRAYYAIRNLSTSFGQPTGAVFGFINMLNKILKHHKPDYLAVCFDVSRQTFRQEKFKDYKIQRPAMPDELSSQMPFIKEIATAFKFPVFEKEGYEADDVIATLVKKAKTKGVDVTIVSADKDIMQLVDEGVSVFSPYKDEGTIYSHKEVSSRFGIEPKQIPDIIALMGDSIDNIPGVKGIGEKTAVELIRSFGSLDKLLTHLDEIKKEKLRSLIKDNIKIIKLSKELAELNENLDLDFNLADMKLKEPDYDALFKLYKHLEFKSLIKDLPLQQEGVSKDIERIEDKDIPSRIKEGEIYLLPIQDKGNLKCILLSQGKNDIFQIKDIGPNVKVLLTDSKIKKISYNFKEIKILLNRNDIPLEGPYFDTMIVAYLLNPVYAGLSLSEVVGEYLGIRVAEDIQAETIDLLAKLKVRLEKLIKERQLEELYQNIEMPLIDVLAEMEIEGVGIDAYFLRQLSSNLEKKLIGLVDRIYDLSGTQFNINSPKQLGEILFERLKLPVIKRSKTAPSTSEEVLRQLSKQHKLPCFLLEYRSLTKLKNTYIDVLPRLINKKTNKIHTSFNQIGAETGRISSSDPNLQNIPIKTDLGRQIRKAIVASHKDGFLLSSDYSQIELRILAHISKDKVLIKAFHEEKDIHKFTAALLYNTDESSVTDEMREIAKRINFGIIYGLSPFGLANDLGITQEEAKTFIDEYFLRYAQVKEYIDRQVSTAKKNGYVKTLLGRRRYLPDINSKNQSIRLFAERQAVNTPIQGSAADLIKLAMVNIAKEIKNKNLKSRMILQVHDELIFDLFADEIKEMKDIVKDKMENVLRLDVPIRVSIKKGKNWLEMEELE